MNKSFGNSFLGVLVGFACVLALFSKREKKPSMDDAEVLLQQAQQQMKEAQARNRVRAVQAITQKNNLQAHIDRTQRLADNLGAKAEKAREAGDVDLERQLNVEQVRHQRSLQEMEAGLQTAIDASEAVKTAMRREEERIRAETARALAMQAQYKQAQIEFEIEKSRLGMTTTNVRELFERAQTKIRQAQARRDLMAQIRATIEMLEESAEEALQRGDEDRNNRLLHEGNKLREKALNPHLWER